MIDFAAFREIADEAGAYLLADISHIAGLVAAGEHPSPIDHAHFTTTSTYKQLFGPRGGLVLMGRDHDAPAPAGGARCRDMVQRAAFPFFQGTPNLAAWRQRPAPWRGWHAGVPRDGAPHQRRTRAPWPRRWRGAGYTLVSGGTDNHMVLVDVSPRGLTGMVAERALE